jgi:hypothetical protein
VPPTAATADTPSVLSAARRLMAIDCYSNVQ